MSGKFTKRGSEAGAQTPPLLRASSPLKPKNQPRTNIETGTANGGTSLPQKKSRRVLRLSLHHGQRGCFLLGIAGLIACDAAADAVLLPVDAPLLGLGQMTVVRGHIGFFPILDRRLAFLEIRGLLRG
jgi:hypothetical protein